MVRIQSLAIIYLFLVNICLLSTMYWKDENKEKRPGMAHFLKKNQLITLSLCGSDFIFAKLYKKKIIVKNNKYNVI